jgi:hypothetical protein
MAVRVGFEPTEPVKVQRFSRPPDSTALAPHRIGFPLVSHSLQRLSLCRDAQQIPLPDSRYRRSQHLMHMFSQHELHFAARILRQIP